MVVETKAPEAGPKPTKTVSQSMGSKIWVGIKARSGAFILAIVLFCVWELLVRVLGTPLYVLPPPSAIFTTLIDGLASGYLIGHTLTTLQEVAVGYVLAVIAAFAMGFAVTRWRVVENSVLPLIYALQTVPKIALAPLIITWFGFGTGSKVVMVALLAFFPLLVNLVVGLQSADRERVDMFRALNASEWIIFQKLRLPNALPYIFAGLDIAIIFSIIGAIVAEFIGSNGGLGYLIQASALSMDVPMTFAVLVILSVLGAVLHAIVSTAGKRLVFWQGRGLDAISGT